MSSQERKEGLDLLDGPRFGTLRVRNVVKVRPSRGFFLTIFSISFYICTRFSSNFFWYSPPRDFSASFHAKLPRAHPNPKLRLSFGLSPTLSETRTRTCRASFSRRPTLSSDRFGFARTTKKARISIVWIKELYSGRAWYNFQTGP